jgi:hypothetical protein
MTTLAKFGVGLMLVLTLPVLAAAAQRDPVDRFDALRLRAEIRREVRDAVRGARRDVHRGVWSARRDLWRARIEARREFLRAGREARREAHRAAREAHRHAWRW